MAFSLTDIDDQYSLGTFPSFVARLKENFRALQQDDFTFTGIKTFSGAVVLSGGAASSVVNSPLTIDNNKSVVFRDSAGGTTNCGYLWYNTSHQLLFGAANFARLVLDSAALAPFSDNAFNFGSASARAKGVYAGRMITGAATPTAAVAAGFGTSPSIAVDAGSADLAGIITVTAGSSPGATGSVTVTFSTGNGAYGTNVPQPVIAAVDGTGAWDTGVTWKITATSTTGFTIAFKNAATNFTAASTYKFAYHVIGK